MTNALAYTDTINKLPRRTAQVLARRPGITTGFSTGKKLLHDGAKWLQSAAPGLSPHRHSPDSATQRRTPINLPVIQQQYLSLIHI